jgi:hypothetical protein
VTQNAGVLDGIVPAVPDRALSVGVRASPIADQLPSVRGRPSVPPVDVAGHKP